MWRRRDSGSGSLKLFQECPRDIAFWDFLSTAHFEFYTIYRLYSSMPCLLTMLWVDLNYPLHLGQTSANFKKLASPTLTRKNIWWKIPQSRNHGLQPSSQLLTEAGSRPTPWRFCVPLAILLNLICLPCWWHGRPPHCHVIGTAMW